MDFALDKETHQSNHVHHSRISRNEEEESNLDGIRFVDMAGLQLFNSKLANEVVFGFGETLIHELIEVFE